ncbi:MAG: virulence associated protein, partial [Oscillospiraceae bacterium]|nr:virulence associated protein [Oscillospiraceae bacterium]
DDSNEKYGFRTWLLRLGLNGADFKEDRKRLMANLSGNSAFRNDEEKARWTERQKAKREAQKAAAQQETTDTDGGEQHEVLDCD